MAVVLILEDEAATAQSIADALQDEGFLVLRTDEERIDAQEVARRLRARLRQRDAQAPGPSAVVAGDLVADPLARTVRRGDAVLDLAPREFDLLLVLMRHADRVVDRKTLFEDAWRYTREDHSNVVDVHVGRLRRKLEAHGGHQPIHTVRGIGYVLVTERA